MIKTISTKFQTTSAAMFLAICINAMILPYNAMSKTPALSRNYYSAGDRSYAVSERSKAPFEKQFGKVKLVTKIASALNSKTMKRAKIQNALLIGGPSQPEMSAFKSVSADNMVNLFSGDFSYNIPLMDVGGYPVNIFYDGGVNMEQEASWVGLGWNINPGNVNRNMRGIPDDFNGEEVLTQTQKMKPNVTWGVTLGADIELVGIKNPFSGSAGASLGVSFNNYLGPALDLGIRGNTSLKLCDIGKAEKGALTLGGSLNINASSRSGVSFSPSLSLTAKANDAAHNSSLGFGLKAATSYNSKEGVKALQLSEQMSYNFETRKKNSNDYVHEKSMGAALGSTTISFAKPSYIPSMRMPLTNNAFSGHFQLGTGIWGFEGDVQVEVFKQKSEVANEDVTLNKPMVGYMFLQNAKNNTGAVMDFTRMNDNEVTPTTPIISAPQYAYDVFSIQGEGTGGSIRAYRNDDGYVRDNYTLSKDKNTSIGGDVDIPGHYGGNFNRIKTPSTIGDWVAGNSLHSMTGFGESNNGFENIYFRNPGESGVVTPGQFDKIGGLDLVRFKLGGTNSSPVVTPLLERFNKDRTAAGTVNMASYASVAARKKRTQVISFLTAEEASIVGLDKMIRSYNGTTVLNGQNNLNFQESPRYGDGVRKPHHISQINVTESNGQRYVYGIPVYNLVQKDFTFTVAANNEDAGDPDKVTYGASEAGLGNPALSGSGKDGYVQITQTPAYAQSFLLSGLLSPDYVDVTNNGITEDDLGNAVKFNYTKIDGVSKWRTPLSASTKANFLPGKKTESKDDKATVSYGERESWYTHSIESKTMIAVFTLENRNDAKTAASENGGINTGDNTAKRLQKIDLYNKADLKANSIAGAKPIKTVHFEYSYELCKNTPDHPGSGENGKLTLKKIYFTFNGQSRVNKNQYVFSYNQTDAGENPDYEFNGSDRWGTYKSHNSNPGSIKNADHPYGMQDATQKAQIDKNAGAWLLKKILLPSGGQMEINYESDDYAFVQNKRAADMMSVVGFGKDATQITDRLYSNTGNGFTENNYAFLNVPAACSTNDEVFQKYFSGIEQLSFKLMVMMPKGPEYVNAYAIINPHNCGIYAPDGTHKTIWVKLELVDGKSPLSLTAVEFLREQLPGQVNPGYDVSESSGLSQIGDMLAGWLQGLRSSFTDPVKFVRQQGFAQQIDASKTFVRVNDPDGFKYGGGYRVRSILLKDNWKKMNHENAYTSQYETTYDYTTTEVFNGTERQISSGVASYEPSLGGDENPFHTMIQVSNKVPLGPTSYGAVEMPVLDAFFPAPSVGYSKISVRSVKKSTGTPDPTKKSRSGIGRQVTEFYTAKDFPVYYSNTSFDPSTDMQANSSSSVAFFYKYAFDSRALSQGFLVETNDMHGKMKSQVSYSENDDKTVLTRTDNFYRNTGAKGLDDRLDFVYADQGGNIISGNVGIDAELMTDTREFSVKSKSFEVQAQVDWFPIFAALPWLPFIWPVGGASENTYRAVTTTKVVNYHGVLDSVSVIDKGSQVGTKNMVFDSETGDVIVNRTNNEFKLPVYTTNYPAWWAYSGMSQAYKNIDAVYKNVTIRDGKITSGNVPSSMLESGDIIYLTNVGTAPADGCAAVLSTAVPEDRLLWVLNTHKESSSLTDPSPDYYLIDKYGNICSRENVSFRIIQSGKKNMLSMQAGNAVTMANPVVYNKLTINNNSKVLTAGAAEYKEKWQNDNDVFKKFVTVQNPATCSTIENPNCSGHPEKNLNPYQKGLLGNFRSDQSKIFYYARNEQDANAPTNLPVNGYLSDFKLYWDFNNVNNLVPDQTNPKWVWTNKTNKFNSKGMELETKDALNIYTSAQYGFSNTLPVAITNNAKYSEAANAGFEDDQFTGAINAAISNICAQKYVDFGGMTNAAIVSEQTAGVNAHTGSRMMKVNANTIASKQFSVSGSTSAESFPLVFGTSSIQDPVNQGVTVTASYVDGNLTSPLSFGHTHNGFYVMPPVTTIKDCPMPTTNPSHHKWYNFSTAHYVKVTACNGTYNIRTFAANSGPVYCQSHHFTFRVFDLNNNEIPVTFTGTSTDMIYKYYTCTLSSGIYRVESQFDGGGFYYCEAMLCNPNEGKKGLHRSNPFLSNDLQQQQIADTSNETNFTEPGPGGGCDLHQSCGVNTNQVFGIEFTNTEFVSYKDLSPSCNYTTPISGTEAMLNPVFKIPVDKKMLVSMWVKQTCGSNTTPCTLQTYTQGKLDIDNGAGSLIHFMPSGPIIEGWQKIEGDFTIPASSTSVSMNFINSSAQPVYFDDIRIQPYNANMKSFIYDPTNLKPVAELDANNYALFYEYDDEGTLIRTKAETKEGIKTIKETRSAKQSTITDVIP